MKKFQRWWYEFIHGHPFLLDEEVDIIIKTRSDEKFKWMNDAQIQYLIKMRIRAMYRSKFPKNNKL